MENAGMENAALYCSGGERGIGNRGRREIMESEHYSNMLLNVLKTVECPYP